MPINNRDAVLDKYFNFGVEAFELRQNILGYMKVAINLSHFIPFVDGNDCFCNFLIRRLIGVLTRTNISKSL